MSINLRIKNILGELLPKQNSKIEEKEQKPCVKDFLNLASGEAKTFLLETELQRHSAMNLAYKTNKLHPRSDISGYSCSCGPALKNGLLPLTITAKANDGKRN